MEWRLIWFTMSHTARPLTCRWEVPTPIGVLAVPGEGGADPWEPPFHRCATRRRQPQTIRSPMKQHPTIQSNGPSLSARSPASGRPPRHGLTGAIPTHRALGHELQPTAPRRSKAVCWLVMILALGTVGGSLQAAFLPGNTWPNPSLESVSSQAGIPTFWHQGGSAVSIDGWASDFSVSPVHSLKLDDASAADYGEWWWTG